MSWIGAKLIKPMSEEENEEMKNVVPNRASRRIPKAFRGSRRQPGRYAVGGLLSSAQCYAAAIALLVAVGALADGPAVAQTLSGGLPDVTLSMSVMSLTERDGSTDVTVTAVMRKPVTRDTTIFLDLGGSPLLTPGVTGAPSWARITPRPSRTTPSPSLPETSPAPTTFAIDPTYDTYVEGDEAIVLTGATTTAGLVVAPTDLIIEDGLYLSFPSTFTEVFITRTSRLP